MSQVKSADNSDSWRQLWQLASRAVGLPSASRTASVLLHTVLERNLVLYHDVSDDINSIVTTADVNGPALLVDSSITLMSHLRSLRNVKLPNASQSTNHHVIRWIFRRWNPGTSIYKLEIFINLIIFKPTGAMLATTLSTLRFMNLPT